MLTIKPATTADAPRTIATLVQAFERDPDRAEWAGTRDARAAYLLSRNGSLAFLADCKQKGWTSEKKNGKEVCYPYAAKDGLTYGWEMP